MAGLLGFVFGLWFLGAILSSPYFWAKRTDKSAAPIVRRFTALAYGLAWPFFVTKYFQDKKEAGARAAQNAQRRASILGDGPALTPPAGGTAPRIKDPFDKSWG